MVVVFRWYVEISNLLLYRTIPPERKREIFRRLRTTLIWLLEKGTCSLVLVARWGLIHSQHSAFYHWKLSHRLRTGARVKWWPMGRSKIRRIKWYAYFTNVSGDASLWKSPFGRLCLQGKTAYTVHYAQLENIRVVHLVLQCVYKM